MTKSKRKKPVKKVPQERLEFLVDKYLAHEMAMEARREHYEMEVKPRIERQIREARQAQRKINQKIDERNRERLARQLEYTRYSSKKPKVRFIHPN